MTEEQQKLSRRFIIYRLLSNFWFLSAIWLYFYRLFITDQQVGFLDGLAFAIGLLAEVPSGALADKFGRNKIAGLGQILAGGGLLIQAMGSSFAPFFMGQAIMMIGVAFISGADEALFYQRLKFNRDSINWRKLITLGGQADLVATLSATLIGGWFYTINPRLPWVMTGLAFIISSALLFSVADTRAKAERLLFVAEVKTYLGDIKNGFAQFRLPKLQLYVPLIVAVQGLFYVAGLGILRLILMSRFHFSPFRGSIIIALCGVISIVLLALMHRFATKLHEKRMLVTVSLTAAVALLASVAHLGNWGFLVILVLYAGERTLYPFMSEILNAHAPEDQRATVLSVASFLRTLPYVILAPIIGTLNTKGRLQYFLIAWSVLIGVALFLYVRHKKRDELIDLVNIQLS